MAIEAGFYIGKIEGKQQVIDALNDLKPELYKELVERMADEAESIAAGVNRAMPNEPPLSGFAGAHKTGWDNRGEAKATAAKSAVLDVGDWPVYKIALSGYAGAVTDIAGAGSRGVTLQGQNMIAMLNSRHGRASRWVWPVGKRHTRRVERKMREASDKVQDRMSARMARGPGA